VGQGLEFFERNEGRTHYRPDMVWYEGLSALTTAGCIEVLPVYAPGGEAHNITSTAM